MSDSERLEALRLLTSLYRPGDYTPARTSMPTFIEDESGAKFEEFFDFLQAVYLFQSEYGIMEEEEVRGVASSLKALAQKYKYPINQFEVFL